MKIKGYIRTFIDSFLKYITYRIGFVPSHSFRNLVYRHILLVKMQKHSIIYFGAEIRASERLHIGEGSVIGDNNLLDARNGIYIGNNVNLSSDVHIFTQQHDHRDSNFACNSTPMFRVQIDDRAWIGPDTTILPRVRIGEGAVVAAGAVVTKDVAPFTIVAGIPAKKIGERNTNLVYELGRQLTLFY